MAGPAAGAEDRPGDGLGPGGDDCTVFGAGLVRGAEQVGVVSRPRVVCVSNFGQSRSAVISAGHSKEKTTRYRRSPRSHARALETLAPHLGTVAVVTEPLPTVRTAAEADRDALWPLVRDFATSFVPRRSDFDATLPRLLAREDDTLLLLAEAADGGAVGYLLASTHLTFLANGPVAWVEEVMVDAAQRSRGIGRLLMGAAEQWAASRGAAYVSLASRRAGAFYGALGYDDSAVFFKRSV